MPVILDRENYDLWLDPGMTNVETTAEMLMPFDASLIRCYPISSRINNVANDDEQSAAPGRGHTSAIKAFLVSERSKGRGVSMEVWRSLFDVR